MKPDKTDPPTPQCESCKLPLYSPADAVYLYLPGDPPEAGRQLLLCRTCHDPPSARTTPPLPGKEETGSRTTTPPQRGQSQN